MRLSIALALAAISFAQPASDRSVTADVEVGTVRFVDGGKLLAGYGRDGKVVVWNASTGSKVRTVDAKAPAGSPFAFVPQSSQFGKVRENGHIALLDAASGGELGDVVQGIARPRSLAFAPGGKVLSTAHTTVSANSIEVRGTDGTSKFTVPAGIGGISILGFSPNGQALVAGGWDADLRVWNARNGELIRLVTELKVAMFAQAFSPDGKLLATGGVDRTLYLWDTATWKLARKYGPVRDIISAIAFSSDGQRLVTGGFDDEAAANPAEVILWDPSTGKHLFKTKSARQVSSVDLSPDGKTIAVAARTKAVQLVRVP